MSRLKYGLLVLLGAASCAFAGGIIVTAGSIRELREELGAQSAEVQKGNQTLQLGRNMLSDMVQVAPQSPAVLELLRKVGITVQTTGATNGTATNAVAPSSGKNGSKP